MSSVEVSNCCSAEFNPDFENRCTGCKENCEFVWLGEDGETYDTEYECDQANKEERDRDYKTDMAIQRHRGN